MDLNTLISQYGYAALVIGSLAMFYGNESRDSADVRQCFCRYAPRLQ